MNLHFIFCLKLLASMFPIIAMTMIYLFCYWLPKLNCRKKQILFEQNVKIGQEVTTKSGVIGVVVEKDDKSVTIKSGSSLLKIRRGSLLADPDQEQ